MRVLTPILIAATLGLTAPAATAAPTCQDRGGEVIRCGTAGAMPVGWALPMSERPSRPASVSPATLASLIAVIGGLFALIALMPSFDGWRRGDWGPQPEDDEEAE